MQAQPCRQFEIVHAQHDAFVAVESVCAALVCERESRLKAPAFGESPFVHRSDIPCAGGRIEICVASGSGQADAGADAESRARCRVGVAGLVAVGGEKSACR